MASEEQVVWTGRCLRCLHCNQQIEVRDGNMELAVNLHMEEHSNQESNTRRKNDMSLLVAPPSKVHKSNYNCPICKENVEIKYNDVSLSLKLHSMKHQKSSEKSTEDKRSNCSSTSKNSMKKNSEEVQIGAEKRSNSSSGKSQDLSYKKKNREQHLPNPSTRESSILDDTFNAMPPGLKAHRGFMLKNSDGKTSCKVCNVTIENMFSIYEHLNTKFHEDNAIASLKNFIAKDRLYELDFVSFYGSNLCCNLCKCRIDLSSNNPYETIVNIFNHNVCKSHIQNKSGTMNNSSDVSLILHSLLQINPAFVNENKHYVAVEMQPQISCNLCCKQITYDKDLNNLFKNFSDHCTSAGHTKFAESSSILKIFKGLNMPGIENHNLSYKKGKILCTLCSCNVEADLEKLEEHVRMIVPKQFGESTNNEVPLYKQLDEALAMHSRTTQFPAAVKNKEPTVQSLLKSMPAQFRDVNYIVQNDSGQLSCLLCNCTIPMTNYNLETHLTGGKHKKSEEAKRTEKVIPETPEASLTVDTQVSKIIDKFFNTLLRNDAVMAGHESVLVRFEDGKHYVCNLCGIFIESSQDLNNFRANLYSHVQSEMHNNLFIKRNKSNSTTNIHKGIKLDSLQNLFEALPLSLAPDMQFIKANQYGVDVFCTACNVKVPAYVKCLQDHLEGGSHAYSVKKNSGLVQNFAAVSMDSSSSQDRMLLEMTKTDKVIKSNSEYIVIKGEDYFCTLCHTPIKQSFNSKDLKDNFLNHFYGQKHKKLIDQVMSDLLDKLVCSNPVFKAEKAFLKVQNKAIRCTLCDITMSSGLEKGPFEKNVVSHLVGKKHKVNVVSHLVESKDEAKKNLQPIKNPVDQPLMTIQSTKPKFPDMLRNPFLSSIQSVGDQSSYVRPIPPPLMPSQPVKPFMSYPPLVPLLNQPIVFDASTSENLVADAFKKLPPFLQGDSKFIRNGTVDGFLACTLCSYRIINPYYLRDHLSEARHLQEKKALEDKTSCLKSSGSRVNI